VTQSPFAMSRAIQAYRGSSGPTKPIAPRWLKLGRRRVLQDEDGPADSGGVLVRRSLAMGAVVSVTEN